MAPLACDERRSVLAQHVERIAERGGRLAHRVSLVRRQRLERRDDRCHDLVTSRRNAVGSALTVGLRSRRSEVRTLRGAPL
jgi:hypothetical protein